MSAYARSRVDLEGMLRRQFDAAVGDKGSMNFSDFLRVTKCRSRFFAERLFDKIDVNSSQDISFDEFVDAIHILQTRESKKRIHFIFDLFDVDGDGFIQFSELKDVLRASVQESDSSLPEEEVADLAEKLKLIFLEKEENVEEGERPAAEDEGTSSQDEEAISLEAFQRVLEKYPDVLEGLSLEGVTIARPGSASKRNAPWFGARAATWAAQNPQQTFQYAMYFLIVAICFAWRFSMYAGNCDGADMDYKNEAIGLSRNDVMDLANNWRSEHNLTPLTVEDMKYMSFGKSMTKNDPDFCANARKRRLMSWSLPVAKAAGQAMKGTFTLILFPVSRNLMTSLRNTFLKNMFNFDDAVSFHRNLGRVGFFFAWVHTLCHVVDVYNWSNTGRFKQWSWAFPRDFSKDSERAFPPYEQDEYEGIPSYLFQKPSSQKTVEELLSSSFGITGIILISIYSIAALFALDNPKSWSIFDETEVDKKRTNCLRKMVLGIGRCLRNFNNFWYTHHLFAIFYIAMLLHPWPNLPNERKEWGWSDSWVWVGVPVLIYLFERILRFARTKKNTRVIAAELLPGNVVGLKVLKPRTVNYTAGMYAFINIPQLSQFEWHPFTLTSSPGDNYLSFHIRAAGDWTKALYKMVAKYHESRGTQNIRNGLLADTRTKITRIDIRGIAGPTQTVQERFPFTVFVDGPFGAPAQDHDDYNVMILVGAGIGVTPFASVLNDILDNMKKGRCPNCGHIGSSFNVKKVYFYWTLRLRTEAIWFKHLLEEIALEDTMGILDINIHVTSIRKANDIRVTLLRLAQTKVAEQKGVDVMNQIKMKAITKFGRPNWDEAFTKAKIENPEEREIGVFYCGPNGLAKVLKGQCEKHSKRGVKFDFMKESFG